MKTSRTEILSAEGQNGSILREPAPGHLPDPDEDLDLSLLEDSLAKTPWQRMQANDDALRFSECLRAAMERRNAKP
jgi:hypothetical protein